MDTGYNLKSVAAELSEYLLGIGYETLDSSVVRVAKDVFLDQLGCQIVGSTMPWSNIIHDVIRRFGTDPEATVLNHGTRLTAHDAAFVNAAFGQGCELDDVFLGGGHPGAMCVPVAIALAEREKASGKEVISAIVAGYEMAFRLRNAMAPAVSHLGFHPQSIFGVFSSTTVAAKLLKLSPGEFAQALAIAGSQASGTMEYDQSGGEVKRMHAGLAVRAGIYSSLLARAGLTGPLTIFEGKKGGILHCFSGSDKIEELTRPAESLGILQTGYKLVPAVRTLQSPTLLLLDLVRNHNLTLDKIDKIDVDVAEYTLTHGAAIGQPTDVVGAQFSLAFSLAVALVHRKTDLDLYLDPQVWKDADVVAAMNKIAAHADDRFTGDKVRGSRIRVTTNDGRVLTSEEDYCKGDPNNPLSRAQLHEKFINLAGRVLADQATERIMEEVERLDRLDDASHLVPLLVA